MTILGLARVGHLELRERFVNGDEVVQRGIRGRQCLVDLDALATRAVFNALIVARPLDENAPHRQSGGGKEVTAALPLSGLVRHAQVGLVDEGSRLQSLMRLALAGSLALASFRSSSYTSGRNSPEVPGPSG